MDNNIDLIQETLKTDGDYNQALLEETCLIDLLTEEEKKSINELTSVIRFEKGTILTREGQVSNECYHILEGCARQYYLVDGEEKTTFFYTEGQSISSSIGTSAGIPSRHYIEVTEDSMMSIMKAEDENTLYKRHPRMESMCRISLEQELKKQQDILVHYMISTPEERYLNLLKTRPELLNRVPQYQLASYLGVKPESLSRIRKRLAMK